MARTFTDELRDLRKGAVVVEATQKMAQLVQAVASTGKPGKLVVELTVRRASKGSGALTVMDKITIKSPEEQVDNETLMFATPEGSLLTQDPRQATLDLKQVPVAAPDEPLRVATP